MCCRSNVVSIWSTCTGSSQRCVFLISLFLSSHRECRLAVWCINYSVKMVFIFYYDRIQKRSMERKTTATSILNTKKSYRFLWSQFISWEKQRKKESARCAKGLFDMKQILKSNFGALQTTRRDWVIMENKWLFTEYFDGNGCLFIVQLFSVSRISLDFQFPNT